MSHKNRIAATLCAAGAIIASVAPSAEAAAPEPFTIEETINFGTGTFEFEATGALCESGTFVDEPRVFAGGPSSGRFNLVIDTVYTCADESGTFFAQKHVHIVFGEGDSRTNTGPIQLQGGTGDYAGLRGHGFNTGVAVGDEATGTITGYIVSP